MGTAKTTPWIRADEVTGLPAERRQALDRLVPLDGSGRVLLTQPGAASAHAPLSVGMALDAALEGYTKRFTMLVGYFAHDDRRVLPTAASQFEGDPSRVIEHELSDLADTVHLDPNAVGFRLMFGELSSVASAECLRHWWLLCRWRSNAREDADKWRGDVLNRISEITATNLTERSENIDRLALEMFDPASSICPFVDGRAGRVSATLPKPKAKPSQYSKLLLYLVQRAAEIRVGVSANQLGIFHPKLYVLERENNATTSDVRRDTVVIAGSANWSMAALAVQVGGGNTEVATIHRVSGHPSDSLATQPSIALDLADTAERLYRGAAVFAEWTTAQVCDDPGDFLSVAKTVIVKEIGKEEKWKPDPWVPPSPLPPPDFDVAVLARALRVNIELALGLSPESMTSFAATITEATEGKVWGGKTPSAYQIEGALRLYTLLRSNRGALLSDEPGLGKTLIAQMVAAVLIKEAILARRKQGIALPVRVSILAPKRVLGQAGEKWFKHAHEIQTAVEVLLQDGTRDGAAAAASLNERLLILPMSNQSLSQPNRDDDSIAAFHHLAASEVVILDEAHNFRNGSGRGSRLLRFCLAMPVPGELTWAGPESLPLLAARAADGTGSADVPAQPGRKVLMLTATPFNNRMEDVRTQLGHFAKAMRWVPADKPVQDAFKRRVAEPKPITDAYWDGAGESSASGDFLRLLGACDRHFQSSRAIDADDSKEEKSERKNPNAPTKAAEDGGPTYFWAGYHSDLGKVFEGIVAMLRDKESGEAAMAQAALEERRDRVDGMLVGHVVQRSRRQVLRLIDAERANTSAKMFRRPDLARVPLALCSRTSEPQSADSFEAEVLGRLMDLIASGERHAASKSLGMAADRITMAAYGLRFERGQQRANKADSTARGAATNFIGFQAVGLVKRLQSSPYAFVMTLVRGLLRTSLYELALVDQLVERLSESEKKDKPHKSAQGVLLDAGTPSQNHGAALDKIVARVKVLLRGEPGGTLVQLMGLTTNQLNGAGRKKFLWLLAGLNDPDAGESQLTRTEKQLRSRLLGKGGSDRGDIQLAMELMFPLEQAKKSKKQGKKLQELQSDANTRSWLTRLLDEVSPWNTAGTQPTTRPFGVIGDLLLSLEWLLGSPPSRTGLLQHVFHDVDMSIDVRGASAAEPMRAVAATLQKSPAALSWVEHTLKNDGRATDLIAWLLGQTLMRGRSREGGVAAELVLPAGNKSLIFSEYADTLDYLRTLLLGVYLASQNRSGKAREVQQHILTLLAKRVPVILRSMNDSLDALRTPLSTGAGASAVNDSAQLGDLVPPPPVSGVQFRDWFGADDVDLQILRKAIEELFGASALVTGRQPKGVRLRDVQGLVTDAAVEVPFEDNAIDEDGDDGLDDQSEEEDRGESKSAVLDAFSPWYQIDLGSTDMKEDGWRRLEAAKSDPVHALFATEVLSEGVNLQECGVVVHYDLPWNPTRLIQRNGRVDRRINGQVETAEGRLQLVESVALNCTDAQRLAVVSAFRAPSVVYHLTVPPVEPQLSPDLRRDYSKKVREILFTKLSGIREIFGLSAWPIVLEEDEARKVLDGRLAYETPAFQRREDLFVAYSELAKLAGTDDATPLPPGIQVSVSDQDMSNIQFKLAGLQGQVEPDRRDIPLTPLGAVALFSASPAHPVRIPVRSELDFRVVTDAMMSPSTDIEFRNSFQTKYGAPPESIGALLLVGWLGSVEEGRVVVWEHRTPGGVSAIEPRLFDGNNVHSVEPLEQMEPFSWLGAEAVQLPEGIAPAGAATSPTAAFEAGVIALSTLVRQGAAIKAMQLDDSGLREGILPRTPQFRVSDDDIRAWRLYSAVPIMEGSGQELQVATPKVPDGARGASNIFIVARPSGAQ
jgi:hypothetical protein